MEKTNIRKMFKDFLKLCSAADSAHKLDELLELFLTINERKAISDRYHIIEALLNGQLTQREITQKYQVSIAKITRGSNELKTISKELKNFLTNYFGG